MSLSSQARSDDFLRISREFQLGALRTEAAHPITANLSDVAKENVAEALRLLFEVDDDVIRTYCEWANSPRIGRLAEITRRALENGGRIFFTGCGSTGRLSIQLAAMWRDFWQQAISADMRSVSPPDLPERAIPVMAGGDYALIKAVEGFEDYANFGRKQLKDLGVSDRDIVFAITEGGETSFVIGTAWQGVEAGARVCFVYNNPDQVLCERVKRSREIIQDPRIEKVNLTTGPMAITGSTRMQATSIQLCVLATLLEMVVRGLLGESREAIASVPQTFLGGLVELQATLKAQSIREELARVVDLEESVYRAGRRNNYFADGLGIDVLTDTTERSPTYCTPAFRKFDDATATESWAFLFVPAEQTGLAWRQILRREPRCIEWPDAEIRNLVAPETFERTFETLRRISSRELMRFRVGLDGLACRPPRPGDGAVAVMLDREGPSLIASDGFFRLQLEAANAAGARTGLIWLGSREGGQEMRAALARWIPACTGVFVPVPVTGLWLDGVRRVGVKMLLNALSTCTMVRLGRVEGNCMVWVVPSNLKLIDRATRYIQLLTALDYREANRLLFEVIEYVEPRMKTDQAYPPVVGLAVLRARHGIDNEQAERRLRAGP